MCQMMKDVFSMWINDAPEMPLTAVNIHSATLFFTITTIFANPESILPDEDYQEIVSFLILQIAMEVTVNTLKLSRGLSH